MPIFPSGYTQKTTPADDDQVLIGDSAASNAIKKTKISSIVTKAVSAAVAAIGALTNWITTSMLQNSSVTATKMDLTTLPAAQQAWQTMTPTVGSVTTTLGYYKDSLGVVHFRGQLNMSGTGVFFTLPAGYRPEQYKEFGTSSAGSFGVMAVATNGQVSKIIGSNGNLDLDCVTFRAA